MAVGKIKSSVLYGFFVAFLAFFTAASGFASQSDPGFEVLKGRWVRPDGGYVIHVKGAEQDGKLDAVYANPNPLAFAKAEAAREGKTITLFFELRAAGYNGSTYTLTYDPANDVLKGVYFQAVAQQKYDVYFRRAK